MKPDLIMKKIAEAVKAKEELSAVVCRYSESKETAPNPVCGFTLCLGVDKSGFVRNSDNSFDYNCSIKLCLLAPSGAGGKRLLEVAQWIIEAVRECVEVESAQVSGAKFNSDKHNIYCDILVAVKETQEKTESELKLRINGEALEGVVSAQAQSVEEVKKKGQLLNGYTEVRKEGYILSITTDIPLKAFDSLFEVEFDFGGFTEIYEGAEIREYTHKITSTGGHNFIYEIKAKTMKTEVAYEQ